MILSSPVMASRVHTDGKRTELIITDYKILITSLIDAASSWKWFHRYMFQYKECAQ